jgi:hypothetical protein
MDGIVGSLKLGWNALLFKDDAYEKMSVEENPVVKGLILIIIVGVIIALFAFVGDLLEWASTPDLGEIKDTVYYYMTQMPWWKLAIREDPTFVEVFKQWYDFGWSIGMTASPSVAGAALIILLTPVALVIRWLIYGLLAYLFARWLGGTADLSKTLGVLALAVAPQALNALTFLPFVQAGSVIAVWGVLCAYVGLKKVHGLSWGRAVWATLLPFILVIAVIFLASCLASAAFAAAVGGIS